MAVFRTLNLLRLAPAEPGLILFSVNSAAKLHRRDERLPRFSDVAPTTSPGPAGRACAPHPARPRADGLRDACLLPSPGASCRGVVAADAWVDWHLLLNPYRCIATHRCLWPVPWGDYGERVARRVVCCRRFGVTDPWPREGSARSGYLLRCLVVSCWCARRSRLRSDGDPRSPVWKAHRTSVCHLITARQV